MKKVFTTITLLTFFTVFSQETNNNVTICWDTSFSMLERDIEKEFEILDKVFQRTPNQIVQLVLFNNAVEEQFFKISNGDWSELKETLVNLRADGGTSYEGLSEIIKNDQVYFFSDGKNLAASRLLPVKKGNFIVNSVPDRNEEALKKAALIGRGRLMDFAAVLPGNLSKKENLANTDKGTSISGTVYIDNEPYSDIELRVMGSDNIYKTDGSGRFNIPSVPGDSILISSRSFRTMKTIPVGYFSNNVDVFMNSNVTELEEVIVSEKRIDAVTKEMVNTGIGAKSKESVGFAVQSIGEDEITPIQTDLNQTVQGRFSNINLASDQDLTQFSGRSNNTLLGNKYGLVVVDGIPIQQSDSSTGFLGDASFINPDNVAEITVLKGFAATNRYGTAGNAGVILITTKTGIKGNGKNEKVNSALVQNNLYDPKSEIVQRESAITKTLKSVSGVEEAYNKYLSLRLFNQNNDAFFLDSFEFFKEKDNKIASRIISNLWELYPENAYYLKLVELSTRSINDMNSSEKLNKAIHEIKPTAIQSYFTEAQLELEKGNHQNALDMWVKLAKGGAYGTLQIGDIQKSISREIKNLVFKKRSSLNVSNLNESYFKNEKINVRLQLEWSNPKAEFKVQFVNPQNRYFNWEHTKETSSNRIEQEVNLGFAMEEFELYDDLKGDWQINVNYLGNLDKENTEPLVVLCSVYTNFGYPSQTRELKWLYLDNQNPRKKLIKIKI